MFGDPRLKAMMLGVSGVSRSPGPSHPEDDSPNEVHEKKGPWLVGLYRG